LNHPLRHRNARRKKVLFDGRYAIIDPNENAALAQQAREIVMRTSANMRYSGIRFVGDLRPALRGLLGSVTVIAFLVSARAGAQTQQADQSSAALQEVVVTGSLIKRTDTETPSPVQVISEQDIKNSGYTNVSDVLRNLAANGQGTLNQAFTEAFAAGASGVALRGLSVGDTLTLIDSERMVAFPLSDDGERSFVDTTAIPFNAIDSIEVLKDGASALYGADAIAGVVNIKLK
jgi:outer membrane receptor protein involved in Fe transport